MSYTNERYAELREQMALFGSLPVDYFQEAVAEAKERIRELIGERPKPKDYKRSSLSVFTFMDILMAILYTVLLLFSLIHVFSWTRTEAIRSYEVLHGTPEELSENSIIEEFPEDGMFSISENGIEVGRMIYVIFHQISVLGVSELGIIVFSMFHAYRGRFELVNTLDTTGYSNRSRRIAWFFHYVNRYFFLALAFLCAIVVLYANWQSGFNIYVSILIPLMTIALSERFSSLFSEAYRIRLEGEKEFEAAEKEWINYELNPTTHEEYLPILGSLIIERYRRTKFGKEFQFWSDEFEHFLAAREIALHSNRKVGIEAAMEVLTNPT